MNNKEIIISGVHQELTDGLKALVQEKAEKLFNHETRIIRLRVELEKDIHSQNRKNREFIAKGHIEINGPTLVASAASENFHKSVDQMVAKLDRKLRRKHRLSRVKRKQTQAIDIPAELPKLERSVA